MPYRFAVERQDYGDYASGRVFYSLPGTPAFPVRLGSEMLQRGTSLLRADGLTGPWTIYDPCCGSAYLLSTLAYAHWQDIQALVGSDVSELALSLAQANLSLLTTEGLERRMTQIEQMWADFGKASHREALESAGRLKTQLLEHLASHRIDTRVFCADATDAGALRDGLQGQAIDIVISDVPYGQHSAWQGKQVDAAWHMLEALRSVVAPHTVLVIAADKAQTIAHRGYHRRERLGLGKRQVTILRPGKGNLCR